jgi:hypothetical protein
MPGAYYTNMPTCSPRNASRSVGTVSRTSSRRSIDGTFVSGRHLVIRRYRRMASRKRSLEPHSLSTLNSQLEYHVPKNQTISIPSKAEFLEFLRKSSKLDRDGLVLAACLPNPRRFGWNATLVASHCQKLSGAEQERVSGRMEGPGPGLI